MMNWTRENTLFFIHLIRERPAIWDVSSAEYKHRLSRNDAIEDVAKIMNISVRDVNTKWTSLRGQFNREKRKFADVPPTIIPPLATKWFAYNLMDELMTTNGSNSSCDSGIMEDYNEYSNNEYVEEEGSNKEWNTDAAHSTTHFPNWQFKTDIIRSNERSRTPLHLQRATDADTESVLKNKRTRPNLKRRVIIQSLNTECDVFGQYVAAQLKNLYEEDAVLAQAEIHALMTRYRLKKRKRQDNNKDTNNQTETSNNNVNNPEVHARDEFVMKCEVESD